MLATLLLTLVPGLSPQPELAQAETIPESAGYALPILDLDQDANRHMIVDQEEGQYLGHVTTALLGDGKTILAVYPKGHGKGAVVYKRSTDGGLTWSERLPVPESWASSKEVPTLFQTVDSQDIKRVLMFSGLNPIRLSVSEDEGQTWSELEAIGDYGGIVACSTMVRLANGEYLAMFHDDGRFMNPEYRAQDGNAFHVYQIRSSDGGLSWSEPQAVATHPRAHLCEPLIVRSPDGKQLLCLMRENSRQFNSFYMTSDDEGQTWSTPRQLTASLTGDRHTGGYAPDGRLLLSFRDTARRSPTQGDWVAWVGTYHDIIAGREGQYRVRLKDNHHRWDCAYPGVEILPNGSFVATTYGHWTPEQSPYILSTRFQLRELDQRLASGQVLANPPNPAIVPAPRPAEWWQARHALMNQRGQEAANGEGIDLIFIGDSITHGWEGHGSALWQQNYAPRRALNLGISGDRTQHVLWRLENGNLDGLSPKLAVIMIGTNNSNSDTGEEIADGVFAILRRLRAEQPQMKILLLNIFPRGANAEDRLRKINDRANQLLQIAADDPMVDIMDLAPVFLQEDGTLPKEVMPDLLHPEGEGYRMWAEAIEERVAALLGE